MTPPREYKNLLEEYIDRQEGMWRWIANDPLNRTCKLYRKKFMPNADVAIDNLACDYADMIGADDDNRCEICFLDSNLMKCAELMGKFSMAVKNKEEDKARAIAIEIAEIPLREGYGANEWN